MRYCRLAFALALTPLASLAAQEHDHHGTEKLGRVIFPVSCNTAAQEHFATGMAMLHSFWWEKAPDAFNAALAADPDCTMAHWGLAINSWGNPFAGGPGAEDVAKGARHAEQAAAMRTATPREQGLIAAAQALYRGYATVPMPVRLRAYSDTLARVYRDFPDDPEVTLYYALSLVATAVPTDTTLARQRQAAALLNPLYARFPDHPGLAHYIIHANDSPRLASLGLDAARRYATIAPSAPHAQHMPSHIFIRLGLWDETIATNQRAYDAGVQYARGLGINGVYYHEFHALDYMVYGMLQEGRDSAARKLVTEGLTIREIRGPTAVTRNYNVTAMEARLPLERGDWAEAARLPVHDATPWAAMLTRFARGIGAARSGQVATAKSELAALERVGQEFTQKNETYWARITGIKAQALRAWVRLAEGDTAGALRDAREAADTEDVTEKHPITPGELLPARELEADLHFALKHYPQARAAYLATLERERGRARSLFGAARSAELTGEKASATQGYRTFLEQMRGSDGQREELAVARAAVR